MSFRLIAVLTGSYLLGCFLSAYYVARWRHGVDIRASGSGNAEHAADQQLRTREALAEHVHQRDGPALADVAHRRTKMGQRGRVQGLFDAGLTLFLDATKGAIAVVAGAWLVGPEWAGALALTAAIVGHIWPVQLSFHGGKGAATGLGGMLFIDPVACLALLGVGAVAFALTTDFFKSGLIAIGLAAPMLYVYRHDAATVGVVALASFLCLVINHPVLDMPRQPRAPA